MEESKRNIVFTYITPFHPERGGIGRVTHLLTVELLKRGYNVYYLIYESGITVKHEYNYPVPLIYYPSKNLLSAENIDFYHSFLKEKQIDIVINQSGNFSDSELYLNKGGNDVKVISVLHQPPWVAYQHLWNEIYPLRNDSLIEKCKRIARILLYPKIKYNFKKSRIRHFRNLLPKTDVVCMLSENYYKDLTDIFPGYESKYISIPNPNSYEDLSVTNEKKKQLLYVGLLVQNKRVDRLIEIWNQIYKRYPDWELIILGEGNQTYVESLKKKASKAERIKFEGFRNPTDYYQSASILCMTSNYEGWGMVLTEAMQFGTVPIAFNASGAFCDIIDNNLSGILVSPFDTKEYSKKLCELMDNPRLLIEMSKKAQEDIKRYSVKNVVDLWEQVL